MTVKERIVLEDKVLQRYEKIKNEGLTDKLSFLYDIEYSKVDVERLLEEDDKDFIHDVAGIICSMDRKERVLKSFTPRAGFRKD